MAAFFVSVKQCHISTPLNMTVLDYKLPIIFEGSTH